MFRNALISLATFGALASNVAMADELAISPKKIDLQASFKTSTEMEIATLSEAEMKETRGSWLWVPLYYAPAAAGLAAKAFHSSAYMPGYHLFHAAKSHYYNWRQ